MLLFQEVNELAEAKSPQFLVESFEFSVELAF